MQLSPRSQAVLLLNVSLGKSDTGGGKPLSRREWARFAKWLKDNGLEPSLLLKGDLDALLRGWEDPRVTPERLRALLNRGAALGLSLERWERAGLWMLTRSDADYPERLKRRLGATAPAVLFGCGNRSLPGQAGIAVVGSRNADEDDLAFASKFGAEAAEQGYTVVSGGARGIDRHAMQGALEREGRAVGVLADSLLRSSMAAGYRQHIMSGDLALISPFNPEAGFNVGNAMARNACIYCLADAAVVVCSDAGKGGTWSGAVENLEHRRGVPLWVKPGSAPGSGNAELVRRGAKWLPPEPCPPRAGQDRLPLDGAVPQFEQPPEPYASAPEDDGLYALFLDRMADLAAEKPVSVPRIVQCLRLQRPQVEDWLQRAAEEGRLVREPRGVRCDTPPSAAGDPMDGGFYALFLDRAVRIAAAVPMTTGAIAAQLGLRPSQAAAWLRLAVKEHRMVRRKDPVRYRAAEASLFADNA